MAYFIIETEEQLMQLQGSEKCFIELVSLSEESHPKLNSPCVLYYNDFEKGYIISINHSEAFSIPLESVQIFLSKIPKVYLLDKKWHSYFFNLPNAVDVYFTILDLDGNIKDFNCFTNIHNDFHHRFNYSEDVNAIIPISKHYERCECMYEAIRPYIGKEGNLAWQNAYIDAYKWVEEQGLTVDLKLFDKYFEPVWKARSMRDSTIYTSYNLYNVTSRPTNAFNGINFLAFNKDNHSRSTFIPKNDVFVEFDFDGYHLRLVANLLNIEIPLNESIHTHLGKLYFNQETLTPEEYQESKKITFRQMYNGVDVKYKDIPLFQHISELVESLWAVYQLIGYVELPNERKLVQENANPQKLFNYYIQCLETVNNVKKLTKLKNLLEGKKSRIVLVVYDSILVDFSKEDGRETLDQIKRILEEDNYVIKAQIGNNYNFHTD